MSLSKSESIYFCPLLMNHFIFGGSRAALPRLGSGKELSW